jgi:hypothetical protein
LFTSPKRSDGAPRVADGNQSQFAQASIYVKEILSA